MARRFSNCAFTYLRSYVATEDKCGVSVGTLRPAADETYMYSQDTWEDDQGILWKFQQIVHQDLFNVRDLQNFRKYEKEGGLMPQSLNKKVFYIGKKDQCLTITDIYGGEVSKDSLKSCTQL